MERTTPKRKGTLSRGSDLLLKAITYGCVSTDVRPRGVRFDYMVADAPNQVGKRVSKVNLQKSMWVRAPS